MKSDLAKLHTLSRDGRVEREARETFNVNLNREQLSVIDLPLALSLPAAAAAPSAFISSAPKPWGRL